MISTQSTRKDYKATANQTIFAYDFLIYANTDLEVYVNDVKKTLTTDYTVSGVGSPSGGNVTFGTGLISDDKVIILRTVPYTQAIDYISNDKFPAETHETALDKLTILILQAKELIDRAIKYKTTSLKKNIDFPEPQSGQFVRYKADGSGLLETAGASVVPGAPAAHASTHAIGGGDTVAAIFSKSYVSPEQIITSAGALTLAHNLGAMPKLIQIRLKCQSINAGYSVGDEVVIQSGQISTGQGISIVPDSTNLYIRFGNVANCFQVITKDTGGSIAITNTNWTVIFLAWA